jgi:hypothetical protein
MKERLRLKKLPVLVAAFLLLFGSTSAFAESWKFGVISDTQWTVGDDGYNPNTVAAWIIKQIDQEFIKQGVDLVIAVGDTVNEGETENIYTRALYAQDLYNAGIGFYPLRGNHEVTEATIYPHSAAAMQYAFPQIGTGVNNHTPNDITTSLIPTNILANNPPADKKGHPFVVGTSFSEPRQVAHNENSLSYAFRYKNATFMLLDQFDANSSYTNSTIPEQMDWISKILSKRPDHTPAFVFAHKNILGQNHKDNMFGGNIAPANAAAGKDPGDGDGMIISLLTPAEKDALDAKIDTENAFIACMEANYVPLVFSGHDHNHYFSAVTSPDGHKVDQLITQSDSSKFYTPQAPYSANDIEMEQDLYRIGYYIVTVDGSNFTIDYYADTSQGDPDTPNDLTGAGKNHGYFGLGGGTFNFKLISTITYHMP